MDISTPEVIDMLHRRYSQERLEWANTVEFVNIDFLSVNCWKSKGYAVHGHEIKVSRQDWRKELDRKVKSWFGRTLCDYWWLVAPRGVARNEEIPEGWGYIEISPQGLMQVLIKAPVLRPQLPRGAREFDPETVHRKAFAMMARRYAFAQADRDHLLTAVDEPTPYLDEAARRTGRVTSDVRQIQAEYQKEARRRAREWKARTQN